LNREYPAIPAVVLSAPSPHDPQEIRRAYTRRCKSVDFLSQRLSSSVVIIGFLARIFYRGPLAFNQLAGGTQMKQSDKFRENAETCSALAREAKHGPARIRYKRMETAWLSLADEQDWLDGEVSPENIAADCDIRKTPAV
jgi:hypothetical protein